MTNSLQVYAPKFCHWSKDSIIQLIFKLFPIEFEKERHILPFFLITFRGFPWLWWSCRRNKILKDRQKRIPRHTSRSFKDWYFEWSHYHFDCFVGLEMIKSIIWWGWSRRKIMKLKIWTCKQQCLWYFNFCLISCLFMRILMTICSKDSQILRSRKFLQWLRDCRLQLGSLSCLCNLMHRKRQVKCSRIQCVRHQVKLSWSEKVYWAGNRWAMWKMMIMY